MKRLFTKMDYFFLAAAYLSFMASTGLFFFGHQVEGDYVGHWVSSILSLWVGIKLCMIYNKKGV